MNLKLKILGESSVEWKTSAILPWRNHKYKFDGAKQNASGTEVFLNSTYNVFDQKIALLSGNHDFKFNFDLPTTISPSFKGKYGEISYSLIAFFSSENSLDDLNSNKIVFDCFYGQNPTQSFIFTTLPTFEASKTYNKCFRESQPLRVIVGMPSVSFLSGEDVLVLIHIDNESGYKIVRIIVNLVEVTKFKSLQSQSLVKEQSEIILTEDFFKKAVQENDNLEAMIKLPYLNPIFLSKIISVSYEFQIELKVSHFKSFPKIKIPLDVDILEKNV